MPNPRQPERLVPGTTITESSMERMLKHNREIVGDAPGHDAPIDHQHIAENLLSSQPVLLPGVGGPAAPRVRASRFVERVLTKEGVQGTSPTPGQDRIDYVPPTTSNTADPGNDGKGPDAETEPASKGGPSKAERLMKDLGTLFGESDNPFADKDDEDDKDGKDKGDGNGDEDDKDKDKDKDDKDGKGKTDDDDEGEIEESVEVHCESCGYEEIYELSESSIAEGNVPLTPDGKLDSKCPMCGADMDLSMIGATNTGEISDPNPRTDARGNSPQRESVSQDALTYANGLMQRIVAGESVEAIAKVVVEGDFMERKSNKRQPAMAGVR